MGAVPFSGFDGVLELSAVRYRNSEMQPLSVIPVPGLRDSAAFVFQIPIGGSVHFLVYNVRITGTPGLRFLFGYTATSGGAGTSTKSR
jgi:hypothetical protein